MVEVAVELRAVNVDWAGWNHLRSANAEIVIVCECRDVESVIQKFQNIIGASCGNGHAITADGLWVGERLLDFCCWINGHDDPVKSEGAALCTPPLTGLRMVRL